MLLHAALSLLVAGCGSSDPTISAQDGQKTLTAVQNAASQLVTATDAARQGQSNGLTVTVFGSGVTIKGTLSNPAGGTMTVMGTTVASTGGATAQDLTIQFNGWTDTSQNLNLTGSMTAHTNITAGSAMTAERGDLTVSGSVNGLASINATVTASGNCTTTTGTVSGNMVSFMIGC
jgi:septum formation inhibitor MinC